MCLGAKETEWLEKIVEYEKTEDHMEWWQRRRGLSVSERYKLEDEHSDVIEKRKILREELGGLNPNYKRVLKHRLKMKGKQMVKDFILLLQATHALYLMGQETVMTKKEWEKIESLCSVWSIY